MHCCFSLIITGLLGCGCMFACSMSCKAEYQVLSFFSVQHGMSSIEQQQEYDYTPVSRVQFSQMVT